MPKMLRITMPVGASGGRVALIRWCERPGMGGMRRARGGTVRLGNRRRRRLTLRRLARWSRAQWRVVVQLLMPVKRVLMEVAAGQRIMQSQRLSLPFVYSFPFPLI